MRLATESMVGAIEEITIYEGMDPRDAVLVGGGGAAGLNSVAVARRLGCKSIVIPEVGAALSAAGALISDLQAEYRALFYTTTDRFDLDGANAVLDQLRTKCQAFIEGPGAGAVGHAIEYCAEARYRDQIWEIDLPLRVSHFDSSEDVNQAREDFNRVHEEVFAFRDTASEVQFVGWRATVRCKLKEHELGKLGVDRAYEAEVVSRKAYFAEVGMVDTRVELLEKMAHDDPVAGPAIIESPYTTVVIDPGATAILKESGSLVINP
jgi:N-methylhydantoinase A